MLFFNTSDKLLKKILKYEISITYEDMYGKINNEQYIIDFSCIKNMLLKSPPDEDVSLNRINNNLKEINLLKSYNSNISNSCSEDKFY